MEQGLDTLKKRKLDFVERQKRLTEYEGYVTKYPKGQLCTFYLRGLCWFENCQFAHGIEELNLTSFMQFCKDKKEKKVTNNDLVRNVQKTYLIFKRDYKFLYDFQEANKDKIGIFYTFEQLSEDLRKRTEIRRIFHHFEFEKFSRLILSIHGTLTIDQFEDYTDSLGFSYSVKYYSNQKFLFSKSITDRITNKRRSIIKLMPKEEDIILTFIKILTTKIEDDFSSDKDQEIFPLSFKYVNNIINRHIGFEDPLIHHYCKLKNITQSEFMEELVNHKYFLDQLTKIAVKMNKQLPDRENMIYTQNIIEVVTEIKETFWDKYFNSSDQNNYGYLNFEFIKENYIRKLIEYKHSTINEGTFTFLIKKHLNSGKNLFLMNNNYNLFVFNQAYFNSQSLEDFFESKFERKCEVEDKEVTKILSDISESENELDLLELITNKIEDINLEKNIDLKDKYSDKEIIIVDDNTSIIYLTKISKFFKLVAIDLEGILTKNDCQVDLIQICDGKSKHIFVIDIYKILYVNKDINLFNNVKIIITSILQNNQITKIFHDGRNDCLALHLFFNICPSNYIDTSCLFSAIKQIKLQTDFYNKFLKKVNQEHLSNSSGEGNKNLDAEFTNLYSLLYNSVNPGINKVLEAYEPEGKINHLKDKIHILFGKTNMREEYFLKRPIDEEFLLYSALDVKYLLGVYLNIHKELEKILKDFYGEKAINSNNMEILIRLISNDHLRMNCSYHKIKHPNI